MKYTAMDDDVAVVVMEAQGPDSPPTLVRAADPDFASQADYAQKMADAGVTCMAIASRMGYQPSLVEGDRS